MRQPVQIGSAVSYVRTHPARQVLDAILIGYDLLPATAEEDAVPTARLAIIESKNLHLLRDAGWKDAFSIIDQVPYEPEGEFYHGWSELEASVGQLGSLREQLNEADDLIFAKSSQISELQQTNTALCEQIGQLKRQYGDHGQGETPDYPALRAKLNDQKSTFYGPAPCTECGLPVIKKSIAEGGTAYNADLSGNYSSHTCLSADVKQWSERPRAIVPQSPEEVAAIGRAEAAASGDASGTEGEGVAGSDNLRQMPSETHLGPTS